MHRLSTTAASDRNREMLPISRLYLPKLESTPATILAHLIRHFPQVPPDTWRSRIVQGRVTSDDGTILTEDTPYRHGTTIYYRREVRSEPDTPEEEVILYQDDEILVADKPHGMVVTPAGDHVERSLLVRLQRRTGSSTLVPAHRLDRETGGVILFSLNPETRHHYHGLFADRAIEKEYLAAAHLVDVPERIEWRLENRIETGEPWYRQRIVEGPANAITEIELLATAGDVGLFRIRPKSGRKHQIRVHMASIGFPIVGDRLYPDIKDTDLPDPPLQLLARQLEFVDPLSGESRNFVSTRELDWP